MSKKRGGFVEQSTTPDEPGTVPVTEPGQAPGESDAVIEPAPGEVEAAVENLGEAIRRDEGATGGYEVGEDAHNSAIERMEALADTLELDEPSLVAGVRDFLLDIIKSRPKPWSATSAGEQRDVAAACDQLAEGVVRQIVETIRAGGKKAVRVLLTKVTLGDDTQIVGKLKPMSADEEDDAVMMLHHARGKHVLLTVASVDDYKQEHRAADTAVEEPPLPFESGDHPADDSDLVQAADDNSVEGMQETGEIQPIRTGEHMDVPGHGSCEMRVNLKTGMVEARPGNHSEFNVDVREATPFELTTERDRIADFDETEEEDEANEAQVAEA